MKVYNVWRELKIDFMEEDEVTSIHPMVNEWIMNAILMISQETPFAMEKISKIVVALPKNSKEKTLIRNGNNDNE